jgi:prophage antirepressor-like protein
MPNPPNPSQAGAVTLAFASHGRTLRAHVDGRGEPWFVAADVCRALDLPNTTRAMGRLDDDERGVISTHTPGGKQDMLVISESGLYNLILGSRKPEAKAFKRWVTHEVLPEVRRTGRLAAGRAEQDDVLRRTQVGDLPVAAMDAVRQSLGPQGMVALPTPELELALPRAPTPAPTDLDEAHALPLFLQESQSPFLPHAWAKRLREDPHGAENAARAYLASLASTGLSAWNVLDQTWILEHCEAQPRRVPGQHHYFVWTLNLSPGQSVPLHMLENLALAQDKDHRAWMLWDDVRTLLRVSRLMSSPPEMPGTLVPKHEIRRFIHPERTWERAIWLDAIDGMRTLLRSHKLDPGALDAGRASARAAFWIEKRLTVYLYGLIGVWSPVSPVDKDLNAP